MPEIQPVILCGGAGTRLWPLSRAMYPKQFMRFSNGQKSSLLETTLKRLRPEEGFSAPMLLCNAAHRFLVREELERAEVSPKSIIVEPVARNTAAAIAVAALAVARADADAILAVMPSDHMIGNSTRFAESVRRAALVAETGRLVLFGIKPAAAHTGYGYIRQGDPLAGCGSGAFAVAAFCEKPDAATAAAYLAAGGYFWNSGIFVLPARVFLDELARFEPRILAAAKDALLSARKELEFLRLDGEAFAQSPNISVDYAVMERTKAAAMLQIDVDWNDVGSWSSLWESAPRDANGNYVNGDAVLESSRACYVHSEKALVSAIGVEDLVIVNTPDALLVASRGHTQDVSKVVDELRRLRRKEQEQHLRSHRPWGWFETLLAGPRFQVKLLHVKPAAKLSLQMHHHRSEHWVVVHGTGKVIIGSNEMLVCENESVTISATQWHQLENPGKVPLEVIEVQIGTYLGEDDIVRSDDAYRRTPDETA